MATIAWIGTGIMGASMATHIKNQGHTVFAYNRTKEKAKRLEEKGIIACETIAETVKDASIIFTMVGYPKDVEEIFLAENGIFQHAKKGAIVIDMTTSSPSLAKTLYENGKEKGIDVLDAPVSGGDSGAKNATLTIMVGGEEDAFNKVKPFFALLGKSIHYMGQAGNGQHTKSCNQLCVAGATAGYTEAIAYAKLVGVDPQKMVAAISKGAAGSWQLDNMAPRVLREDFAPGFMIHHFVKDMKIAKEIATEKGLQLPMLEAVLSQYQKMMDNGEGETGTQSLLWQYIGK